MDELKEILARLDEVEMEDKDGFIGSVESHFNNISEGAQARIAQLEEEVQTLSEELQATQAANYKLIMAQTEANAYAAGKEEGDETEITEEDKDVSKLIKED